MPIDDEDIRWLLSLVESENLAEIEVRDGDSEVLVRRCLPAGASAACADQLAALTPIAPAEEPLPENTVPIVAPTSGIFYRAPSPETPPYAEVGQVIQHGDTIGLIEVMKLFNDVTATVSGTVCRVLVDNEEQVEAGRALLLVETEDDDD